MSEFKKGEKVKYTGRGFLSYDPDVKDMVFLEKDKSSFIDVWV